MKNKLHPLAKKHGYKSDEDFYKDFPTEESYVQKFAVGGFTDMAKAVAPTVASAAVSFIPGIGSMLAPVAEAIVSNALAPEETAAVATEDRQMMNPHGLKYGGAAPKNLRALHGGRLTKMSGDIYLAKGKPHSKGGIKGDTNMDGKPEIEFEGGELFLDKDGYMISKPIAQKYMPKLKTLSKATDSASMKSLQYLKQTMIADNEQYRQSNDPSLKMKKGGKLPKYQLGNFVPGQDPYAAGLNTYLAGIPQVSEPFKPTTVNPSLSLNTTVPYTSFTGSQLGTGKFTSGMGVKSSAPNLVPLSYTDGALKENAPVDYSTYAKNKRASKTTPDAGFNTVPNSYFADAPKSEAGAPLPFGATKGDKLANLAQFFPVGYNAFMATQKAEVVKPNYNPYNNTVLNNISKMRVNMKPIENQYTRSFATGMKNLNSMGSTGARFTNANALGSELGYNKSMSIMQGQQANNELTQYKNSALLGIGADKVNAENAARLETNANKIAKQQFGKAAFEGGAKAVQQLSLTNNQILTNKVLFNTLQNSFNYKFNEQEFLSMLNGEKPVNMDSTEWIQFNNMLAKYKGE